LSGNAGSRSFASSAVSGSSYIAVASGSASSATISDSNTYLGTGTNRAYSCCYIDSTS